MLQTVVTPELLGSTGSQSATGRIRRGESVGFGCQRWGICEMPPGLIDQLMEKLGSDFEY